VLITVMIIHLYLLNNKIISIAQVLTVLAD
jgi:hypothetical protein